MNLDSSPTCFRPAPARVAVSVTVDKGVYDNIARRAGTLGIRASEYVRRLVDAAWHARVCGERGWTSGDAALDRAVRDVFLLADCEPEFIAESIGVPVAWVEKILAGWREFGSASREDRSASRDAPPPAGGCPSGGASETADGRQSPARPAAGDAPRKPEGAGSGVKKRIVRPWTDADRATLQSMWAEGKEAGEIAQALDRDRRAVQQYASTHRGLCPKRRGK